MLGNLILKEIIKRKLIIIGVVLVVISGLIFLYHLAYLGKIYPYIEVAGKDVSNLTIDEAEKKLSLVAAKKLPTIKLSFGEQDWLVDLEEIEVRYKPKETAEAAYLQGRSNGIGRDLGIKWKQWRQKKTIKFRFDYDKEKLSNLVEMVAMGLEEQPIKPALILENNQVSLIAGRNGRLVKKDELSKLILEKIGLVDFQEIKVPIELAKINLTTAQLIKAQERGELLKNKLLLINYEDKEKKIEGQELLDLISFEKDFDQEGLSNIVENLAKEINRSAENAVFRFDGTRVIEFKAAKEGLELDKEAAKKTIEAGLIKLEKTNNKEQTIVLKINTSQADIKTEEVNNLGIKELIGKGESTFYHSIPSRIHNVALTASKINGVLVAPGEIFSFNKAVGDISAATGYKSAYIIKDGRTVLGDGGGVCQDSTTVFRAALDAGLEIVERHPHSYRVSYYEQNSPPGIDATVYAPSVDLKFRNDTENYILMQTYVDTNKKYLKVEIYGKSDGRKASIANVRLWGQTPPPPALYQDDPSLGTGVIKQIDWAAWGAMTAFDWKVEKQGKIIHQKTFYSRYQPWQAVYLRGI